MKNIKINILSLIIFWCISIDLCLSQQTAMFEHPVYFEDGLGNRDTIIIGGDTTAEQGLNPEFGEIPFTTPFDSVFEVRAISEEEWFNSNPILLKKIIGWTEKVFNYPVPCENIEFFRFVIHIKNFPLKISWNSKLYADSSCILASYFTSSNLGITIGPTTLTLNPADESLAYCVAQHDSVILDIGQGLYPGNLYKDFIYPVNDGNLDTMLILQWDFDYSGSTLVCGDIVSTNESKSIEPIFTFYPNPVTDHVILQWRELNWNPDEIRVFNLNGFLIKDQFVNKIWDINYSRIETNSWPPGMYFIQILSQGISSTWKIIKL